MDTHIRLFSGILMNPFDAKVSDIKIEDIAHALARIPRFGGHSKHFYPVALHCIRAAMKAPLILRKEFLLHDATETYLLDIPKPIKNQIPQYKEAENRLEVIIAQKFNLNISNEAKKLCKITDLELLEEEFEQLENPTLDWYTDAITKSHDEVEQMFLQYFNFLKENSVNPIEFFIPAGHKELWTKKQEDIPLGWKYIQSCFFGGIIEKV